MAHGQLAPDGNPSKRLGKLAGPDIVDIHVGHRLHLRRVLLGMSQRELGEAVGVTFQQIQKYERGTNRIGASRLYRLSRELDVPVSFFFEEVPARRVPSAPKRALRPSGEETPDPSGALNKRETLELIRTYYRIPRSDIRGRLMALMNALAKLDVREQS